MGEDKIVWGPSCKKRPASECQMSLTCLPCTRGKPLRLLNKRLGCFGPKWAELSRLGTQACDFVVWGPRRNQPNTLRTGRVIYSLNFIKHIQREYIWLADQCKLAFYFLTTIAEAGRCSWYPYILIAPK